MKYLFAIFLLSFIYSFESCSSTINNAIIDKTELKTSTFYELDALVKNDPRQTVVFIHTDWCKYCQNMQQTTFRNKKVIDLMNSNFYFISLDAESKSDINFNKRQFKYKPNGRTSGVHELAQSLGTIDGELTYPAFVILNLENEIVFQYASYLSSAEVITILTEASH